MRLAYKVGVAVALAVCALACSTSKGYFGDRKRDAADIVSLGVEWYVVGAAVHVGPFFNGLLVASGDDAVARGYGLEGGQLGPYRFSEYELLLFGGRELYRGPTDLKNYAVGHILCFPAESRGREHAERVLGEFGLRIGAGLGLHVAVDFLELVDFAVVGWFGGDPFGDDLEAPASSGDQAATSVGGDQGRPVSAPSVSP